MDDQEWLLAARRAEQPCVIHFLVCPHSPASGVLLNPLGNPVLTDYSKVDWKGLATAARATIEGQVPKSVGVYIADDASDVMDVMHMSTDTGQPFTNEPRFDHRIKAALSQLTMKDIKAGITHVSKRIPGIHLNTPINGKRPPLGALVLSLKFVRATQMIDYMTGATDDLFGAPAMVATFEGYKPAPTQGEMPAYLREWLTSEFGVVYGAGCSVLAVERTFSI
uniref:Uncharacterized protein n=1 Tax=Pseudomonas fluorescens (strain SBW25) TaxID=216595 RepID=A4V7Q4_PSEFS|nr:hypothetical protein [Pseudomonas fluorescens]CAM96176.1 hypothetical protein pQBR0144 [Pseudomonas fluorescens SBW25]